MKTLLTIFLLALFSTAVYVSMPEISKKIPDSGVCVVEFNASFNSSNSVNWLNQLSDCNGKRVDIVASPEMQKKYKIVVVPTIIIFNNKEEVKTQYRCINETVMRKVLFLLKTSFSRYYSGA